MGTVKSRLPKSINQNMKFILIFCLIGFLNGKHFLIETNNPTNKYETNEQTNKYETTDPSNIYNDKVPMEEIIVDKYNDMEEENGQRNIPCIYDNEKNKAVLNDMITSILRFTIHSGNDSKLLTIDDLDKKLHEDDQFGPALMKEFKKMKETLEQLIVKDGNSCMNMSPKVRKFVNFVLEANMDGADYFNLGALLDKDFITCGFDFVKQVVSKAFDVFG